MNDKMNDKKIRFVLKVGEIFRKEKGLARIGEVVSHARKVRLSNLPVDLLASLLPSLSGKALDVNVHDEAHVTRFKGEIPGVRPVKSQWVQNFLGQKLQMGEVAGPSFMFHVLWSEGEGIKRVSEICDPTYQEFLYKKNFMMRLEDEQLYASVLDRKEGLDIIKQRAEKATVFRACVIPPDLLRSLVEKAMSTDYRIITSRKDPLAKMLRADPELRIASGAKIFHVYGDEESNVGSLRLNHELFFIYWRGDNIFNVMKFENLIFSNYLSRVFDHAWKYSIKI